LPHNLYYVKCSSYGGSATPAPAERCGDHERACTRVTLMCIKHDQNHGPRISSFFAPSGAPVEMVMFKQILVPTDGSQLSLRAARTAVRLAQVDGSRILAMHAMPPYSPTTYFDGFVPYPELHSKKEHERICEAAAASALAKVGKLAKAAGVSFRSLTVTDASPWKAIVGSAKAKRCDLIVMASHGRRGLEALLLGSETTKVLTHARTPVLVCR
jgi:nucleotide-binding universal stress UspA family protein